VTKLLKRTLHINGLLDLHNNVDSRKCYNCDRIGHIAKNCRAPKRRIKDKKPNAATLHTF
jgi:hypothetical protein